MEPTIVRAPAKINLFLHIVGKRPDGYHDLFSLMCPVGLYDTLKLRFDQERISVSCAHPDVPEDANNLAVRAANLFFEAVHMDEGSMGVHIEIDKRIPVGAGLGGGSSDAAAVLMGLNDRFGTPLTRTDLKRLGARIGADIPFFICGRPAVATGIGDRLEAFPYLSPWTVLLVYPNTSVSTAWVYKNLNLRLTKDEKKLRNSHFDGKLFSIENHLVNDLEPVTEQVLPVIGEIKRLLKANGAAGAMMTGSGSTVFGLFADSQQAKLAQKALQNLPRGREWLFLAADLLI